MRRHYIFPLVMLLCLYHTTAQAYKTIPITPQEGHWETYGVIDGLGGPTAWSIAQDKNGSLWFGFVERGVSRYDGHTFCTFTTKDGLPDNNVWVVFGDSKGNTWFGTMSNFTTKGAGVCRYDGKDFRTYTTKDGLAGNEVVAICEDNRGHLWFGTFKNGVSEFDGSTFRNHTTKDGLLNNTVGAIAQDKDGNLWFGNGLKDWYGGDGVTRYDGKSFKHFTTKDGLVDNGVTSIVVDKQGDIWFGTIGGVSRYDGKRFENFTTANGLIHNWVDAVFQTKNGDLWFGTWGGVSRYRDGKFQNFTKKYGLPNKWVAAIAEDREGGIWFGLRGGGVSRYDCDIKSIPLDIGWVNSIMRDRRGNLWFEVLGTGLGRYDGKEQRSYGREDGLPGTVIRSVYEDKRGNIWVGMLDGGLARYDGKRFRTFTKGDGLPSSYVWSIREDRDGILWIGTCDESGIGCVFTFDGKKFVKVAGVKEFGEGDITISYILEDKKGNMWFDIGRGVCKYDGRKFTIFNTDNGLPCNSIFSLMGDRTGNIWIPTLGGGICRYDGKDFRTYTTKDGLAGDWVESAFEDSHGNIWLSVGTGGVHKFDGRNFQVFTTDDGLLSNAPYGVLEDEKGNMIFATTGGFTYYTPPKEKFPPPVFITEVVADKVYTTPKELKIPSTKPRISFAYYGTSFKTKRMRYNYMLEGYDKDWNATWDESCSYENLKSGDYTFKVIAINRDLVYSEKPATVHLKIVTPFYMNARFLVPAIGAVVIILALLVVFAAGFVRHRRQIQAYQQSAVMELQDAREMQMGLMPKSAPQVEGFEIAGFSKPAREVGGDFFEYLTLPDGRTGIVLADVSGKGLKAAMNAVMTSGMVREVAKTETTCGMILSALNEDLYPLLDRRMFVAFGFAKLGESSIKLANAAQPYPMVKRGEQVLEFKSEGELPLGMMPKLSYPDRELELRSGDTVIFYTDGVIEAANKAEDMYGVERLEQVISRIDPTLTPEKIIQIILEDVSHFVGTAEQYDDITVVVVKRL